MSDFRSDRARPADRSGTGWGIPAAIILGVVILGGLFYATSSDRSATTANNTANSGPASSTGAPIPPPTTR